MRVRMSEDFRAAFKRLKKHAKYVLLLHRKDAARVEVHESLFVFVL
jgi:hypothetical protein